MTELIVGALLLLSLGFAQYLYDKIFSSGFCFGLGLGLMISAGLLFLLKRRIREIAKMTDIAESALAPELLDEIHATLDCTRGTLERVAAQRKEEKKHG